MKRTGTTNEGEKMTTLVLCKKSEYVAATKKLAKLGIKTVADLDAYRNANQITTRFGPAIESRYGTLKTLCGENVALEVMNDLATLECC